MFDNQIVFLNMLLNLFNFYSYQLNYYINLVSYYINPKSIWYLTHFLIINIYIMNIIKNLKIKFLNHYFIHCIIFKDHYYVKGIQSTNFLLFRTSSSIEQFKKITH